jgi:hypothetical protein
MKHVLSLSFVIASMLFCSAARALTVEQQVTPQYVKEHPDRFKITVEQREGMMHFTIVYSLREPRYLVSHFTARNDSGILAESHTPLFARERSATFYVVLSKDCLANSRFTLSEHSFATSEGQDIPIPGGTEYVFALKDFAPTNK